MLKTKWEWRKMTNEEQQENEDDNQHHKNLQEVLPSKYHRWEFLTFDYKLKKKSYTKPLVYCWQIKMGDYLLLLLIACEHYNKTYVIYIIYIIYVIHNFNYLWLLMIIDNYFWWLFHFIDNYWWLMMIILLLLLLLIIDDNY